MIDEDEDDKWWCYGGPFRFWDYLTGPQTTLTVTIIPVLTRPGNCGTCSVGRVIRATPSKTHPLSGWSSAVWFQPSQLWLCLKFYTVVVLYADIGAICILCQCVSLCALPNTCDFFVHCINQYVLFYAFVEMPAVSIGRYQLSVTSTLPVPSGVSSEEDEQELLSCKIQGTVKCLF